MKTLLKNLKTWPLWLQVNIALITIAVVVGFGASELIRKMETDYLLTKLNHQSDKLFEMLSAAATDALIAEDKPLLETIVLQSRLGSNNIAAITIKNERGTILVNWDQLGSMPNRSLMVTQTIAFEGEVFGEIQLEWNVEPYYADVARHVAKIRLLMLIFVLIMTGSITLLMHGLAIRPIKRINNRLINFAQGDLDDSLPTSSSEELTRLSESVNTLSTVLKQQKSKDEHYRWKLERQVTKRTTELNQLYKHVKHQSLHDPLTQLPNRTLFLDRLTHSMSHAKKYNQKIAVLFIDLDHFKNTNDTIGHTAGDFLLQQVANRIRSCIRTEDTVARQSGDEFVVMLYNITSKDNAIKAGNHIVHHLNKPFHFQEKSIHTSASIGVCMFPDDAEFAGDLLRNADHAMYQAKQAGRNTCQFYSKDIRTRNIGFPNMKQQIRRAIDQNEFFLEYQPILDINTGWIVSIEALIRWRHPMYGTLLPNRFIPLAEELKIITEIDRWVFTHACILVKKLMRETRIPLRLSVNFSIQNFQLHNLADQLHDIMTAYKIDPNLIQIEISENLLRHCDGITESNIEKLRSLGISFAVDDYGLNHSPLGYLNRIPLDSIKLNRECFDVNKNLANMDAVMSLANHLGILVVAGEIENKKQLNYFRSKHCHHAQGFLFSKPCPEKDIEDLLLRIN